MGSFYNRSFSKNNFKQKKFYLINYRIEANQLRVIDETGKQIGILTKEEALKKAQEEEKDLVLIAPKAIPPVAKIIDFKKFLYQEEKKEKEGKKGVKKSVVKNINLSLFIAAGDLERLVNKGKEFLNEGNQLRLSLTLRGREIAKKEMAFSLVNQYIKQLGEVSISREPKLEGRVIRAVVTKKK
ncbi:MAG: translation initiation factor IF-3 [Patescibacteria group bacterium]|nr:translation initiation factor IF-3 [Patescibacteria group bacterium]